jgi:hypothetical protein
MVLPALFVRIGPSPWVVPSSTFFSTVVQNVSIVSFRSTRCGLPSTLCEQRCDLSLHCHDGQRLTRGILRFKVVLDCGNPEEIHLVWGRRMNELSALTARGVGSCRLLVYITCRGRSNIALKRPVEAFPEANHVRSPQPCNLRRGNNVQYISGRHYGSADKVHSDNGKFMESNRSI